MAKCWLCSSSAPPSLLLWLHLALLVLLPAIADAVNNNTSSPTNLVENGSFEDGTWSPNDGLPNDEIVSYPSPQQNDITGWMVANGSIDWAKNRWERASDCSAAIIDLSGGDRGIVNTSFQTTPNTKYTILLDTAPNPDASTPVKGSFTVAVLSGDASVNSSDVSVDGHGYDSNNIGWHTFAVFFTSPSTSRGNLTLRLSSNIPGNYGPLIDNVRVYEGLHYVDSEQDATCPKDAKSKVTLIVAIVVPLVLVILLFIGLSLWWKQKRSNLEDEEAVSHLEGRLRIFPYHVLKVATQNFHQARKLGEGTFGAVYKGILVNGNEVAVKQLFTKTPQGQDEFINEATVISSVQHRNLVKLKGCCAKGLERFLVYEYMENKSLYQVLWGGSEGALIHLNWATRFRITLGTARGLAYLHEASQPRIIHRDIKAGNILLDGNFEAKIADFGLAKFFPDDKTHVSTRIAGTLGYLAPEYALRGQLSEKADVFSFGIVALELVSGRKNLDYRLPLETQYLLDWAKQSYNQGTIMEDLIDPELQEEGYPTDEVERVIKVGLFCTQDVAAMRPTMSEVVSLLQGSSVQDEKELSYVGKSGVHHLEGASIPLLMSSSFSISSSTLDNTTSTAFSSTG